MTSSIRYIIIILTNIIWDKLIVIRVYTSDKRKEELFMFDLNKSNSSSMSRYDIHKKSELKNLYHAIIKLNRESPLYLIDANEDVQSEIINIKEHAHILKNMILAISEHEDQSSFKMFNDKLLASDNEEIVTANYIGNVDDLIHAPSFQIEVEQLASNQINKGYYMHKESKSLSPGTHSFQINIFGTNYEFEFVVSETEKNKDVLKKISNLINRSDIGIRSLIETHENNAEQRLSLISTSTGTASFSDIIFKVIDFGPSSSSGVVTSFGLNQIYQKPTDSKFSINGIPRTSSSNVFTVNKIYELCLHKTTAPGENVTISLKNDNRSIYTKIKTFVEAYNNIVQLASTPLSKHLKSSKLIADLGSIALCYKNELDSMGLIVQQDASIEIDENLLLTSIDLEEKKEGTYISLRSFRNPLNKKIDHILINPVEYVAKAIVTYPDTSHRYDANIYACSLYSGLMFNRYC